MIEWVTLSDAELAAELAGAANGRRDRGERSACSRYLIARLPSTHVLRGDSWEVWCRTPNGWQISSTLARPEWARAEVERRERRSA